MTRIDRQLITRRGTIRFPAYFPVTTFGDKYPLDRLIQPYLPRLAPGVMVSFYYARQMKTPPRMPILIDSGGFASLMTGARIIPDGRLGVLEPSNSDEGGRIHPRDVLELQEQFADVAFTLDFPIPPSMGRSEGTQRQRYTIANAMWALRNRRRKDLPIYACVQAWDVKSARSCARAYAEAGFDGVAIGGLVPRVRDIDLILKIVAAVKEQVGHLPLHVFGLGKPEIVAQLYQVGVDSVDSSGYVQLAVEGKRWDADGEVISEPAIHERLKLAIHNLSLVTRARLPLAVSTS